MSVSRSLDLTRVLMDLHGASAVQIERGEDSKGHPDVCGSSTFSLELSELRRGYATGRGTRVLVLSARDATRVEWHLSLPAGKDPLATIAAARMNCAPFVSGAGADTGTTRTNANLPAHILQDLDPSTTIEVTAHGVTAIHIDPSDCVRVHDVDTGTERLVAANAAATLASIGRRVGARSMSRGEGWTERGGAGRHDTTVPTVLFSSSRSPHELSPDRRADEFARGIQQHDQRIAMQRDPRFDPFEFPLLQ